jgi:endo-1,4-beta-xylanase
MSKISTKYASDAFLTKSRETHKNFGYLLLVVFLFIYFSGNIFAQSDTIQTNVPPLKNIFAKDFYIGCLLSYRNIGFTTDTYVPGQTAVATPNGGYLIKFHMNSMSPGNNMKPQYTVDITGSANAYTAATSGTAKDSIDTHPIIKFNGDLIAQLNWAKKQGFTFRGHTLIWHSQTPAQLFRVGYNSNNARLSKEKMIQRMENYIKEVIRLIHESWPGLLSAIDVVNEAINDNGTDRTTDSEWYMTFGDNTYLMKAFEFTRKYTVQYGESQIKLYYNDYNTSIASKADGIVRVCGPIFRAGLLDGLGMQEHDQNSSPTAEAWINTYNKYDTICTEMAVTELDVSTGTSTPSADLLNTQANQYGQLFKCFVERSYKSGRGKIISVSKDGLNDAYTFVSTGATSLWDSKNQCKPAYYSVINVGNYYNLLDSLIKSVKTLKQQDYTAASWSDFSSALSAASNAKNMNYSASVSAASGLSVASGNLLKAFSSLVKVTNGVEKSDKNPESFSLSQNYPNPFNPNTQINYSIPGECFVSLKVYNLLGEEITTLVNDQQRSGNYTISFDGSKLSSGIYVYRLNAGKFTQSRKFILSK